MFLAENLVYRGNSGGYIISLAQWNTQLRAIPKRVHTKVLDTELDTLSLSRNALQQSSASHSSMTIHARILDLPKLHSHFKCKSIYTLRLTSGC